jgi:large subunit ribosomal protein L22
LFYSFLSADSFVGKGIVIKGMRRHARGKIGRVEYFHCHYFVRLEEGKPPVDYFQPRQSGPEMLEDWVAELRNRPIMGSL